MIDLLLALWPLFAMIVAGYWLRLQTQRDLWTARERAKDRAPVARIGA